MKKLVFIVNPFSGTNSKNNFSNILVQNLDKNKLSFEIIYTEYPGHAKEIVKEYINDSDIDGFVAVGGDGTVNEVACNIIGTDKVLGVLPQGSGNGFGCSVGMSRDLIKSVKILNDSEVAVIDTGSCNSENFVNVCGIGFDAQVVYKTKSDSSRGFFKYLKTSLELSLKYTPVNASIIAGEINFKGTYAAVIIANGTTYGYDFKISPLSVFDDGLLDVILIKDVSLYKYFYYIPQYFTKGVRDLDFVTHIRTSALEVITESNETFYHLDGEGMMNGNQYKFSLNPASLKLLLPKNKTIRPGHSFSS
jgi:diacylglycerol kinase (ATP)